MLKVDGCSAPSGALAEADADCAERMSVMGVFASI